LIQTINNINVNYNVFGKGKNVILLHGWGVEIKSFEPVHKHLEKKFRTYSIDFPGFGKSSIPKEPWDTKDYLNILVDFLTEQGISNTIIIAHSFGGRIAIRLASTFPEKVNKMILIDSAGIRPKRPVKYYLKVYSYKLIKYILKLPLFNLYAETILEFFRKKAGSKDYQNAAGVMRQTLVKVVNENLTHLLPNITVPTLLIWGENDRETPISDGKLMERLIPDAGLVVLKNAGHFSYLEKLDEFLLIIDSFLKNDIEERHD